MDLPWGTNPPYNPSAAVEDNTQMFFFLNLGLAKSKLILSFIPKVTDSLLVIFCALCNFCQKRDVFEIACLMYFVSYHCEQHYFDLFSML